MADDRSREYRWSAYDSDYTDTTTCSSRTIQRRDRRTISHTATAKLTFTEPLTRRSLLSGEYTFMLNDATGENLLMPFIDGAYADEPKVKGSARNRSTFYHNRLGVRYNYTFKKISVAASATYQNTIFEGDVQLPAVGSTRRIFHHPLYNVTANIPLTNPTHSALKQGERPRIRVTACCRT